MFKISHDKNVIADQSSARYLNRSGIYPVTIKFASVSTSTGGAKSINFNVDYEGSDQTIYGSYFESKEGKALEIAQKLYTKLGIIAGMDEGESFDIQQEEHPAGKEQKVQEFAVIQQFTDLPVYINLKEVYSRNPKNGEITAKMEIQSFFRADSASAEEIVNETEIGIRFTLETKKYSSQVKYEDSTKGAGDAPTAEDVAAWREGKAAARKTGTASPKATVSKAPTAKIFGR